MRDTIKDILLISIAVGMLGTTLVILGHYYDIHNVLINWTPPSLYRY